MTMQVVKKKDIVDEPEDVTMRVEEEELEARLEQIRQEQEKIMPSYHRTIELKARCTTPLELVFPQKAQKGGAGKGEIWSIQGENEVRKYLEHPQLGDNLRENAQAIRAMNNGDINLVFSQMQIEQIRRSFEEFYNYARDKVFEALDDGDVEMRECKVDKKEKREETRNTQ